VAGGECEECAKEKQNSAHKTAQGGRAAQAKRPFEAADDALEREADNAADGILAGQQPLVSQDFSTVRVHALTQKEGAGRKPKGSAFYPSGIPESGGRSLPPGLRGFMEARFRQDFGAVRLHTDSRAAASAQSAGALAYTSGRDIVFGHGAYEPHTPRGLHLLAHELTHVVQQSGKPEPSGLRHEDELEPETSPAEIEADHVAASVLTPGPAKAEAAARPRGLTRSTGWAILGAVIGAVAGGLLGALAGPVGVGVGALLGAGLGAWIGGAVSNSRTDDKKGSARARIHRLLSRSVFDWVVTESEALQALAILQELEKTNPVELFDVVLMMKLSDEWALLREKLPGAMKLSLDYFDMSACHPDHGYIMPGDTIHLEFRKPGQPEERSDDQGKLTRTPSSVERLSGDYQVSEAGVELRDVGVVAITGKSLKDAADLVAQAYVDPLNRQFFEISVNLTPVKRGVHYAGRAEVTRPETVYGGAVTPNKAALALRDKLAKFADLVPWSLVKAGPRTEAAVLLYYDEVDNRLDKWDDPEVLWNWAKAEADRRHEELNKKTPAQEFLDFAAHVMAEVPAMPPAEQARMKEAHSRFIGWLSKHSQDPKLSSYKPADIWARAYVNIISEEITKDVRKKMDAAKEQKRDEEWKKAEVKFGEALEFAKKNIWPATPDQGIDTKEETISETTGEVVKVGYLIMASPAERIIRDKIAGDFLHSLLDRMQKDPEAFNKTSVTTDFADYLHNNPEQLTALQLTVSHPYVEKQEHKVDIPAWQTATEVIVGLIPFVGTAVGAAEVLEGRDMFNHPLTTTEKVIIGVGILLPGIAKAAKLGREAFVASRVVKEFGLEGAEAARVYKIYTGFAEGSAGARLFDAAFRDLKAGRAVDDPKVLSQMEKVLQDLGMTEKETAKALMPAVERQAETVAKEEVQAVKAIAGPITTETEENLMRDPALREALAENGLAAKVLKKCNTPCFPPQATAEQVKRLEGFLQKVQRTGTIDEEALRTFLYERRAQLDEAIDRLNVIVSTKQLRDGSAARDLNAWLTYINSGGTITKGVDPALIQAQKGLSHDIGVEGGRIQAGKDGLTISKFETPFKSGSHGQGFDDIAIQGSNWDKDLVYIVEHKGNKATLDEGQMELDWVIGNIQRLYRSGGADGRMWAQRLAKALEEGRLRGKVYTTEKVAGKAGATTTDDFVYKATKVKLVAP
jgi:hypothetical protein